MGVFLSSEQARQRIGAALDAIDAAHDVLRRTSSDLVGTGFRIDVAERLETQDRTNRGLMYRFFGEIADPPDEAGSLPVAHSMLWARLRVSPENSGAASRSRPASDRAVR